MMRGYGYGPGYGHGFVGIHPGLGIAGVCMTLLLIAIVVVVVILVTRKRPHGTHPYWTSTPTTYATAAPYSEAEAIAAKRFANGEIDAAQFEEIRRTLRGVPAAPPAAAPEPTAATAPTEPMSKHDTVEGHD